MLDRCEYLKQATTQTHCTTQVYLKEQKLQHKLAGSSISINDMEFDVIAVSTIIEFSEFSEKCQNLNQFSTLHLKEPDPTNYARAITSFQAEKN